MAIARLHHADLAGCWVELPQDAQRVLCLFGRQGQHHGSFIGEIMGLETVELAQAAHRIAHRNGGLFQLDGNTGGAAPLVEHGGKATAGGVAQGVRVMPAFSSASTCGQRVVQSLLRSDPSCRASRAIRMQAPWLPISRDTRMASPALSSAPKCPGSVQAEGRCRPRWC